MRWRAIGLTLLLAACGRDPAPEQSANPPAPPAGPQARAMLQLKTRLGGEPVLSDLRHGTNDGKAVLCGQAVVGEAASTPFVMRGGYLVLPADGSAEQFATLQSFCTEAGPGGA